MSDVTELVGMLIFAGTVAVALWWWLPGVALLWLALFGMGLIGAANRGER